MQDVNNWPKYMLSFGLKSAGHPIEYARILMQLGYEPIGPRQTTTFLGKPAYSLPNVFEYISYIRRKQGFFSLYRGNTARVCGVFSHSIVFDQFVKHFMLDEERNPSTNDTMTEEEKVALFIKKTTRDMVALTASVLVSHPFHVITVRTVAQFIGGEHIYRGAFSSIIEIYQQDGFLGYFAGVTPRLLGEILSLWLARCLTYVINTYLIKDDDLRLYTEASMSFLASAVTYPFILVSKVMAVNGSSLAAGQPPIMPVYTSWTDCWTSLNKKNQLKRGSSLLWRYHKEPIVKVERPVKNYKSHLLMKYL